MEMANRLGKAVVVAYAAAILLWLFMPKKHLAPADAERVKEQTNQVFKIQALKVINSEIK